jgi:hypothetical protein
LYRSVCNSYPVYDCVANMSTGKPYTGHNYFIKDERGVAFKLVPNNISVMFDVATLNLIGGFSKDYVDINDGSYQPKFGDVVTHVGFPKGEHFEFIQYGAYSGLVTLPEPLFPPFNLYKEGQMVSINVIGGQSGGGLYVKKEDGEWYLQGTLTGGIHWEAWFTTNFSVNYVYNMSIPDREYRVQGG